MSFTEFCFVSFLAASKIISLEKSSPLREVKIKRNNNGFGISIKGGKEHNRPIIISKCARDTRKSDWATELYRVIRNRC